MQTAELINEHFTNITDEQELTENRANLSFSENIKDPINKAVEKYKNYPIIKRINDQSSPRNLFEFRKIETEDFSVQLMRLKSKSPHQLTACLLNYFKKTVAFLLLYFKIF